MARTAKISLCQFRVEPVSSFAEFQKQVGTLLDDVPEDSDYVLLPELFTVGLLGIERDYSPNMPIAELTRISRHTDDYREFFAKEANRRGMNIVAGTHLEKVGERYLNVAHLFAADGREWRHEKTHIFPAEADWSTSEGDELKVIKGVGPATIAIETCYEAEIPELSRIHAVMGAEIVLCPSYTFTEHGFWRVRHCAQARCIENQIYFAHCATAGEPGAPLPNGYARSSVLSPCDAPWAANGIVAEVATNKHAVATGVVDLDALQENRAKGVATTFRDRTRREALYSSYPPYKNSGAK